MPIALAPGHHLEWAVLAPLDVARLRETVEQHERASSRRWRALEDDDDPRPSRHFLKGSGEYSAVVETEPGSAGGADPLAEALSKKIDGVVYALGLAGWDDPDDGAPYVARYEAGVQGLIWIAGDDGELPTVPGPKNAPRDPFGLARALGVVIE
jgi:hypothetical protein